MNVRTFPRLVAAGIAMAVSFTSLNGTAMDKYDFDKAWKEVEEIQEKHLPRSVTDLLEEIYRESVAVNRWADAIRAFILRKDELAIISDVHPVETLLDEADPIDAQPEPMQAILQLYLAKLYQDKTYGSSWEIDQPTKLEDAADADKMPPWAPAKINATLEAQLDKVFARANELKRQKLADWHAVFDKGDVPESYCPTLFDFAVRDAITFYGKTIPDKTLEKGLALYDKLLDFHRDDENRDAFAMAELERAEYLFAFADKPLTNRIDDYAAFLDGFLKRYDGKTDVVALVAAYKADLLRGLTHLGKVRRDPSGFIYSNDIGEAVKTNDLVAAHDLAAEYAAKWPESPGGKMCADIVAVIEAKKLTLEVERNWCALWPEIMVNERNLTNVFFRLVPVTFDELVANRSLGSHLSRYAQTIIAQMREPAREWCEPLPVKPAFVWKKANIPVPHDLKPGHYILFASPDSRLSLPLFAKQVTVTSLALVLMAGDNEFKGAVHRAESGEPVAGATVEIWDCDGYNIPTNLIERCSTGADGLFSAKVIGEGNFIPNYFVRAIKDGEEVLSRETYSPGMRDVSTGDLTYVDIFTDRSIYRPGQEIKVKGIAYHTDSETRDFRTLPDEEVLVTLRDPKHKDVETKRVKTNKWGAFALTFSAPSGFITGSYWIFPQGDTKDGSSFDGSCCIKVEEYKRPKFTAEFDKASEDASLGKPVSVTGRALSYSGLPVQNAKVAWKVERTTLYPKWWSWFGDDDDNDFFEEGETVTDGNGVFKVDFTPVASPTADLAGEPSFLYKVTADVTDETGEEHTAEKTLEIGVVAWRANVFADTKWLTAEKPLPVEVSVKSLAGEPVPVKGALKVFRLKEPAKPVRKPAHPVVFTGSRGGKGAWDWETWDTGDEILSLDIDNANEENWRGKLNLGVGAYRLVFETPDPNGKTVKGMTSIFVFDPSAKGLGVNVPDFFRIETNTVKVGETLRAYWGTGYTNGYCRVNVSCGGKTILDKAVSGTNPSWLFELPVTDEHRGWILITTTFLRENRLYHNISHVDIPWDNKVLKISAEHLSDKLTTGLEETWKFKVSGPAEVLAFMYDKSLDAFVRHDASPSFYGHFSPLIRGFVRPVLQNNDNSMEKILGSFQEHFFEWPDEWPTWNLPVAGGEAMYCCMSPEPVLMGKVGNAPGDPFAEPATDGIEEKPRESRKAIFAPRKNLKETAFFFPDLETDADGKVSFTFTVPDALTGWKLLMVAHDNELNGGVFRKDDIVTVKPLMCEPNAPRFAREGDDFLFAVKVTNTEDTPQKGVVELGVEELRVESAAANSPIPPLPHSSTIPFDLAPRESKVFEFRLSIPDGCGYLKYVAKAKGESFADGEEGVLPVLSRRILVREAIQLNARGTQSKSFAFTNLLSSKVSDTIRHQDLTVRAVSRPAWYAVLSLPYLMEFPHECCEQTFSRYYANALGQFIANSDPRIRATFDAWKAAGAEALKSPLEANPQLKAIALEATPWVREAEHETAARARLGELFGNERLDAEQKRCIEKLRTERNRDGRWPWFPGGPSSDSITLYILTGFARLNLLAGIAYPDFFADATRALDLEVAEDVEQRLELERKGIPFRVNGFDVRWLYLHSFKGVPSPMNEKDAKLFVEHLRKEWPEQTLETQAVAATALARCGENALAQEIMASIKERGILSEELGMYWKRPYFFSCSVFAAPVSTQALIVEAFREVTKDEESAYACNVWLLKQKQTQDWTTTAATADAVYALIVGGDPAALLAGDTLAEVTLGGEKVPVENAEAGTGMWSHRYAAEEIKPEMGEITFKGATEKGVAWGGVHWSYFEDVLKVRAHEPKELRVEKKYYKKVKGPEGTRLTAIEGKLEQGDEIVARLEITSDRTYEFVHLSDERPACAEPVDVLSSYRWRDGVGYYQSTKDTATHYYIDRLNKGVFVLETSFRVQQRGTFSGGLATIQCMYAPEFTAHSTAERVTVGQPEKGEEK